jgi:hypothetical protein
MRFAGDNVAIEITIATMAAAITVHVFELFIPTHLLVVTTKQHLIDHQGNANKDSGVCNIKGRPVALTKEEIEKIYNMTEQQTVYQITQSTTDDESQGYCGKFFLLL